MAAAPGGSAASVIARTTTIRFAPAASASGTVSGFIPPVTNQGMLAFSAAWRTSSRPVHETPTKPGRPGTGLELVRYAATKASIPWFVTGGMNPDTVPDALAAGARRIVVVRAITEAADPPGAAATLRRLLDEQSV